VLGVPAPWFLIQTVDAEPTTWLDIMDRYGLPMVGIVALVIGFRWLYLRCLADRDRAIARSEALEDTLRVDAIPALVRASEALDRVTRVMERLERRLDGP
jgi:hypothetical protein